MQAAALAHSGTPASDRVGCTKPRSEVGLSVSKRVLERVAAGEAGSVDALLDAYGGLVWSLARRFCANRSDAEDAVQEILAEIWRSAARYDSAMGSESTFIATIARRRLINRIRRKRLPNVDLDAAPPVTDSSAEDVGARPERSEEASRAMEALATLPPEQQKVLRLAIIHGVSHEKIAQSTGQPLGTVKSQIRRGLIKVREALGDQADKGAGVST